MAIRIQRKRSAGWRMPEGTLYVGRPGRWGNPFEVRKYGLDRALTLYANSLKGFWNPGVFEDDEEDWFVLDAYNAHRRFIDRIGGYPRHVAERELRGHDLACWCPIGARCHADMLLEIANETVGVGLSEAREGDA